MLGWQQLNMDEEPFLWINVSNPESDWESGQFGYFSVVAPEESGFYEFFAFLIPNPTDASGYSNLYTPDLVRFTIEVID